MTQNGLVKAITLELMLMEGKLFGDKDGETIEILQFPEHDGYSGLHHITAQAAERNGTVSAKVRQINDAYLLHTDNTSSLAGLERYMRENCAWYHHKVGDSLTLSGAFRVGQHERNTRLKGKDSLGFSLIVQGTFADSYIGSTGQDVHLQSQRLVIVGITNKEVYLEHRPLNTPQRSRYNQQVL